MLFHNTRSVFLTIFLAILFLCSNNGYAQNNQNHDRELLLDAICLVESNNNPNAVGDNGKSRGAYQCGKNAWTDSGYPEPYLPNVWSPAKSREVCRRYCIRYAGKNGSNEAWARVWNGGPKGNKKKSTVKYWQKVKKKMEELKSQRS